MYLCTFHLLKPVQCQTLAPQCRGGCLIIVMKCKNYSSERGEIYRDHSVPQHESL